MDDIAGPDIKRMVVVSVFIAGAISVLLHALFPISILGEFSRVGSISSIVAAFWYYFNRWGWKNRYFRMFGWLCDYPDLNGRWEGTVNRLGENDPHLFVMEIYQTFFEIHVSTFTKNSEGSSIVANLMTDKLRSNFKLIMTWKCRTRRLGGDGKEEFTGTSIIKLSESGGTRYLDDEYYTRRNPQTQGELHLNFIGNECYNRWEKSI